MKGQRVKGRLGIVKFVVNADAERRRSGLEWRISAEENGYPLVYHVITADNA